MSKLVRFGLCCAMLVAAAPLYAQDGCLDSPENPTAVLAVLGGAGALFSAVRSRMKRTR